MTRQNAEKIADSFNYSISPQPCDPEEVEAMRVNYPEPERQSHFMIGFRIPPEADFWLPPEEVADSFAHYISYVLENRNAAGNRDVDQLEYCITDLNSDGQSEVLLRRSCVPTVTRGLDLIMKSPLGIKAGKQVRTFVKSFSFL